MKIYVIHSGRHTTEYIEFMLEDTAHFQLVASPLLKKPLYKEEKLPLFNPKKHKTILTSTFVYDKLHRTNVICRFQHSSGFNYFPMIEGYVRLLNYDNVRDFRYLLLEQHYQGMILSENLPEIYDHFRYQMLQDPRVVTTKVDPFLVKISETPKKRRRRSGTAMISLTWVSVLENPEKLMNVFKHLHKHLKLTLILHPRTADYPEETKILLEQKGKLFETITQDISRDKMLELFDQHEFIVTDGSGSCYEAMIRGCQPIAIDDMSYHEKDQPSHSVLKEGYLSFPNYRDPSFYGNFDCKKFLRQTFPFLDQYSLEEAKKIAVEEILSLDI
ncbi:MAG: hypothetical protein ACE5GN_07040 [Waddliaceae bacterium]